MRIVAVANQKGGVGKTTVAMQVGAELSRRHRVLLVDVDRQQSTVWWAENARERMPFDFAGSQHPNMLSYSASRASNSKIGCKSKQYQSQVKEGTRVHYGPWASYGQTSWQLANYANVAWYSYGIRTP